MRSPDPPLHPPDAWPGARRLARAFARPIERFLGVEAASGVLLLAAALVGLAWANSPWRDGYEALLRSPIGLVVGPFAFTRPLSFWINDGLMVVFFFTVGLEIRREIHDGDLSSLPRAALPAIAALGGMLVPAIIYAAWNRGGPAARGWGVPMATDIAFAVGALALLGKRVPRGVRVLLLALAIIDDLGAIIVIALFYSSGLALSGILVAALGLAGVLALRAAGERSSIAYLIPGAVIWAGFLRAGVHPTLAGVALGLMTPARPWYGPRGFLTAVERASRDLRDRLEGRHSHRDLLGPLARVAVARREAVAPVVHLEAALHPWVAYGVMPVFALANAGVDLRGLALGDPVGQRIALGVVVGLVVGKPVGIVAASFAAERLGLAARPAGVTWGGVALVGVTAGIGFTMAIFIAGLAFEDPHLLGMAKLAVLVASLLAGALALIAGRALLANTSAEHRRPL